MDADGGGRDCDDGVSGQILIRVAHIIPLHDELRTLQNNSIGCKPSCVTSKKSKSDWYFKTASAVFYCYI